MKLDAPKSGLLPDVLATINDKTEMNIISDNFLHRPAAINAGDNKLTSILKTVSTTYGKNITRKGNLLVVQDAKWFTKRSWEIPDEWLTYWAKQLKGGKLTIDDYANMACLTDDQMNNTLKNHETLGPIAWQVTMGKDVLRFYAALSTSNRKALLSKAGIDAATLSSNEHPYLDYLLSKTDYNTIDPDAPLKLYLDASEENNQSLKAESTAVNPEDNKEKKWTREWPLRLMLINTKPKDKSANPDKPKVMTPVK